MKNLRCQYGAGIKAVEKAIRRKSRVSNHDIQKRTGLGVSHVAVCLRRLKWRSVGRGEWVK